jgi:serine/threonine protein kinase
MQSGILKPGEVCGGYRILALIGFGGVAEVYKAAHVTTGEIVALKTLHPFHAGNVYVTEHMLAEAELLSKLNHENVVQVKDVGVDRGMLWMAMEFLSGVTLRKLMKRSGALPIATALYYARETADGVAAAHEMQVIHRDLKPENIFITTENKVKVLDLGAAKFYEWDIKSTVPGTVFGTPLYMSPEHIREQPTDARSDIYSLGLILYEMVAGHHPFSKLGKYEICEKQLNADPPPLASIRDGCPASLSDLVQKALAKERSARPGTMNEFAQSVRAILRAVLAGAGELESLPEIHEEDGLDTAPESARASERESEELALRAAELHSDLKSSAELAAQRRSEPLSAGNEAARPLEGGLTSADGSPEGTGEDVPAEEVYAIKEEISGEVQRSASFSGSGSVARAQGDENALNRSGPGGDEAQDECPTLVMKRPEEVAALPAGASALEPAPWVKRERAPRRPLISPRGTLIMQSPAARAAEISRREAPPSSSLVPPRSAHENGASGPRVPGGSSPQGASPASSYGWNAAFANAGGGFSFGGAMPAGLSRAHLLEYTLWVALVAVIFSVVLAFASARLRRGRADAAAAPSRPVVMGAAAAAEPAGN